MKSLSVFGAVFSEIKNADILNFYESNNVDNDFSFLIKLHIMGLLGEITGCRTWKQNWKQTFDSKLVYILGKTVQEMVLDS